MAVIDSILTEIDDIADLYAKNADTLAARLSPYYTSSLSLSEGDAEAVQSVISIAQSSQDYWADAFEAGANAEWEFVQSCAAGNAENEYWYTLEGDFLCQDEEWRPVSWGRARNRAPIFSMAAFTSPSSAWPSCSGWTIWGKARYVIASDAGGALVGSLFFGFVGAVTGAGVSSGEAALIAQGHLVYCYWTGNPPPEH
jgi:hypothetical protein